MQGTHQLTAKSQETTILSRIVKVHDRPSLGPVFGGKVENPSHLRFPYPGANKLQFRYSSALLAQRCSGAFVSIPGQSLN